MSHQRNMITRKVKHVPAPAGNDAYAHVVKRLGKYREFLNAAQKVTRFTIYCQWLKPEFKRRRNLFALMNPIVCEEIVL